MDTNIDQLLDKGITHHKATQFNEAEACYQQVLGEQKSNVEALHLLGLLRYQSGSYDSALQLIKEAINLKSDYPDALNNLGLVYEAKNLPDLAQEQYEQALLLNRESEQALCNLGGLYLANYQLQRARSLFERALKLNPKSVEVLSNLGKVAHDEGDLKKAYDLYIKALEVSPNYPLALNNLGQLYLDQGDVEKAFIFIDRSLTYDADFTEAIVNKALVLLRLGVFKEGWANYESRVKRTYHRDYLLDPRNPKVELPRPSTYCPIELDSKQLVVLSEQGLGDELFFLRFAQTVKAKGGRIRYRSSKKLFSVLSRVECLESVFVGPSEIGQPDLIASVCELPLLTQMGAVDDIPAPLTLTPDEFVMDKIASKLEQFPRPWIGVSWKAGTPYSQYSLYKEAPLNLLINLMKGVRATWIIMQREPDKRELYNIVEDVGRDKVVDFSFINNDLEEALATTALLDDYVAVSNTNLHFRASVDKPARVLIPVKSEFRWMVDGETSPWFPTFELYRQNDKSGWEDAFNRLEKDLAIRYANQFNT
ncbi:MAG: hypothetical protein COB04_08275 [Gammaproteobacteria bacterium]|nr:MAG: hypothetical protein COB04_08275 [Gammaproteobacteria bacterium]